MILRKPYAFLIKHFKLIHIILVLLFVYICYKTNSIVDFLISYANNEQTYSVVDNLQQIYTGSTLYIAIIMTLIVTIIVLVLMQTKNKPKRFYIYFSSYLIVFLIVLLFVTSMLGELQYTAIDLRYTKAIKDIMRGMYYLQYIFIVVLIVRATGFNIKKFDFAKDIDALDISEKDNEEFEVELDLDTEDIIARIRKKLRFMKYTYVENKLFFIATSILTVLIISIVIILSSLSKEKIYSENQIFKSNSFEVKVISSYKTKYNYREELISKDKFYLIVNLELKNITDIVKTLDINNTRIRLDQYNVVNPITNKYKEFSDFGTPYYGTDINTGEKANFILVYEVDNKYYNEDFEFQYLVSINNESNEDIYNYKKVAIDPNNYDSNKDNLIETVEDNKLLTFKESIISDASIKINNVEFGNKFTYKYKNCNNGKCTETINSILPTYSGETNPTIMKINYELNLGSKINLTSINNKFIEYFGYIRYTYKDKTYESKSILKDITPTYTSNYSYIEVPDRVYIADKVFLVFKLRNKEYSYLIYEKDNK